MNRKTNFDETRIIICEGPHDRAFFRELVNWGQLPPCQILCSFDYTHAPGRSGFKDLLASIRSWGGFERLADIVIATDSDSDPVASFQEVTRMITDVPAPIPPEASHVYPVPHAPHTKAPGTPAITVLMVPWLDEVGCLETLLFVAATRGQPAASHCVEAFAQCCKADGWLPQKTAKMRLRSFIAGYFEERPDLALGRAWIEARHRIPIHDVAFGRIADFLRNL